MTRISKSPEQLDAEAAATPMTLDELRDIYRDELRVQRIHVTDGETGADLLTTGALPKTNGHPANWTGLPFAPSFLRRIGDATGYGQQYPFSASMFHMRWACRKDHPGHAARPVFRGSLCHQLIRFTVMGEYSVRAAAQILEIPEASAERRIRWAIDWIVEDVDKKRARAELRLAQYEVADEPVPSRLSLLQHDYITASMNEPIERSKWEALRSGSFPDLPEWEIEWSRRLVDAERHAAECDRCRRAA